MKVQHLLLEDFNRRKMFANWINHQNLNHSILFTEESHFTQHRFLNVHNDHIWAPENPKTTISKSFQERFHIDVWAGVIRNKFIGPLTSI